MDGKRIAVIGMGTTGRAIAHHVRPARRGRVVRARFDLGLAERLFQPRGRVLRLDEHHMNAVTGLSASGPAFVYGIIEALSEGGVMMASRARSRSSSRRGPRAWCSTPAATPPSSRTR